MFGEDNKNQNSVDLSGYLKRRTPEKMAGYSSYEEQKTPKMAGWLIRFSGGLIQNERQANYALLAIAAIVFIISGYIFIGAF